MVQYRVFGITFGLLTILLRSWTTICCCWLDVMYQPSSFVCLTSIRLGFMINSGMFWLIFGGPVIALGLTGKSLSAVKWELMKRTRRLSVSLVSETGMFLWMHIAQSLQNWWSTLNSAMFGLSLSLPPLVGGDGGSDSDIWFQDDFWNASSLGLASRLLGTKQVWFGITSL